MSIRDKMQSMSDRLGETQANMEQGAAKSRRKAEDYKRQMSQNAKNMRRDADELKQIGSDIKDSYQDARKELNKGIAANHGKKPGDDGLVATGASLGMRVIGLIFGGAVLLAFIYIVISMVF